MTVGSGGGGRWCAGEGWRAGGEVRVHAGCGQGGVVKGERGGVEGEVEVVCASMCWLWDGAGVVDWDGKVGW